MLSVSGIDRLAYGTLAAVSRLLEDGELTLFDGTRLLPADRVAALGLSAEQLQQKKARAVAAVVA